MTLKEGQTNIMYKHLVAIVEIKQKGYIYHFVSKDAQKVNQRYYQLTHKFSDNLSESLYQTSIIENNNQSLDSILSTVGKTHSIQSVNDLEAFVKLVYDKKLTTLGERLQKREMNNVEQLIRWFNGD